jgi:hypothetical protein
VIDPDLSPEPTLAERQRELVRDELAVAATRVMALQGFDETTVDQNVAQSGYRGLPNVRAPPCVAPALGCYPSLLDKHVRGGSIAFVDCIRDVYRGQNCSISRIDKVDVSFPC